MDTRPREIGQLARGDERQQHGGDGRQRGRRRAPAEEQQVPAKQERLFQVVGHTAGAVAVCPGTSPGALSHRPPAWRWRACR